MRSTETPATFVQPELLLWCFVQWSSVQWSIAPATFLQSKLVFGGLVQRSIVPATFVRSKSVFLRSMQ